MKSKEFSKHVDKLGLQNLNNFCTKVTIKMAWGV